ncbi:hypothetical protein AB0N33_00725 [Pseudarthrobacter oxydans]|uniref:hypothetical protein n=1 Tax=Pseudarthrobacter oxydans TaxID=1671 RepID=UPI003422772F
MEWAQLGPAVIVAVIGFGGAFVTSKIQHKGRPENALIDQLQEEMLTMRKDIADLKTEQQKSKRREMIRDNYINRLREHINAGNPPPPPEWPEGLYD